jgi:hypothetical protein
MEVDYFLVAEKLRGGSATNAQKLKLLMLNSVSASGAQIAIANNSPL